MYYLFKIKVSKFSQKVPQHIYLLANITVYMSQSVQSAQIVQSTLWLIGPLQDPVTWYGINYTWTQITQWDFQNKGNLTSQARLSFVLKVPLPHLHPSVIYSVPCDRILQRAYLALGYCQVLCTYVYVETCLLIMHYFLTYVSTAYLFWYSRCFFLFSDYLLSNNSVNSIIIHKFDFSDEEVRWLFIHFIRLTLSQICKTL